MFRAFQIQRQQSPEDFVIWQLGGVISPAVGGGDGFVEFLVREIEPGRTLVVEVGQRALLEVGHGRVWRRGVWGSRLFPLPA